MRSNLGSLPVTTENMGVAPSENELNIFTFGFGDVDLRSGEVCYSDGHQARISRRECELLRHLSRKRGTCVSRDEILSEVWQLNPQRVITRTIDMHVSKLRQKLRDDARNPAVLKTVTGQGYMVL